MSLAKNQYIETHILLNPLNAKLNPICHLLALLGAHHILNVSRIKVKGLNEILSIFSTFVMPFGRISIQEMPILIA
jgi:hypothetical protein